jgi:UDPglucose 6-dehydrogenase
VPTPSDETGAFTNSLVLDAIEQVGAGLRTKAEYHLVVLGSTVMPGSSTNEIVPALESSSDKICGVDFGYCYSPAFVALATVIKDLLNPDFCLIGESDSKAGDILQKLYADTCEHRPGINRMNCVNAELTKMSVNAYVTTKISFANVLSEVCERLPGASIEVVCNAVGGDSRIGTKYLKGGTAYGGPCFPRDNIAFSTLCRSLDVPPILAEATDIVNERQAKRVFDRIAPMLAPKARVSILGTAYKTGTNFIACLQCLSPTVTV